MVCLSVGEGNDAGDEATRRLKRSSSPPLPLQGATRASADKAAFDELLWLVCAANPVEHAPGKCAACGTMLGAPVMALPDGAVVCDKPDHGCLIEYGNGRRTAAVDALAGMGIAPPDWWEL